MTRRTRPLFFPPIMKKPVDLVELKPVTRRVTALMSDRDWAAFSLRLALDPTAGDLIPGTGGWRKVRLADPASNKGKSGGFRVITFFHAPHRVYVGAIYPKGVQTKLTPAQKAQLKKITESLD